MTKCCINITPLNVSHETLQIRMILISNQLQVVLGGVSVCIIFANVKNKINYKYNLIYVINNAINKND
jgi:hypothetical protein